MQQNLSASARPPPVPHPPKKIEREIIFGEEAYMSDNPYSLRPLLLGSDVKKRQINGSFHRH